MQQGQRPLYVATSVPKFIRDALGDSLYLTGLAFKYSPRPFDNVAVLKNNYEKRFLKDHLRIQLEADTGSNVAASMNMHYLPAIILLRRHYTASGETSKAEELEPLIKRIATEAGKEEYIAQYLGQEAVANEDFVTSISVKNLDKELKKIRGKLYAFSTEVTNGQYEAFLMDLLKNKEYELLDICKSPKTDWRSLLPDEFKKLPDSEVFQNGPPDGARSPVQNISYEAAQEYCKWITKVYNRSDYKKKAHQKVFFRLPTEAEWVYAARADHDLAPYPWGGYSAKNAKGCFLANFEVASEPPCEDCPNSAQIDSRDGGFFPVVADAYFPNDFGLYNTSGNVAEMVAEKGIAKGGSWEDAPDQCTIDARKEYSKPSPAIGFRVFMEVLK
ncbi:MAG TPA: hypothetical protein ENJ95_09020 [Bacteroidetes bacterium]|nr:hypothetical protein [Bacteroidota bacterium]